MCVYVCVFGIHMLKIVVERWFWESKMMIASLIELHNWLYSCLCFSLLEKLFLSNLDSSLTPSLSVELLSYFLSQSRHLSIARWINQESSWPFDSFSTTSRSTEVGSIASRHLSINRDPLACIVFQMFASFFYLVIHSILFHYIHAFIWIFCALWSSLIIFMYLR